MTLMLSTVPMLLAPIFLTTLDYLTRCSTPKNVHCWFSQLWLWATSAAVGLQNLILRSLQLEPKLLNSQVRSFSSTKHGQTSLRWQCVVFPRCLFLFSIFLFIGLPNDARSEEVQKFFEGYGRIVDCRVMTGKKFCRFFFQQSVLTVL